MARIIAGLVCVVVFAEASFGATPAQVAEAINKGREFLFKAQNKEGTWEQVPVAGPGGEAEVTSAQWGGTTALVTYALRATGVDHQSDQLKRAVAFLKTAKLRGNYAAAFRALVWHHLPESAEVRKLAQIDRDILMQTSNKEGVHTYQIGHKGPHGWDLSNAQIGTLGLWATAQCGCEPPQAYWAAADATWRKQQFADGAWAYRAANGGVYAAPHPSITAAGIATLFLTGEMLQGGGVNCTGNDADANIEKARAWLTQNFAAVFGKLPLGPRTMYALYAFERCAVAGGYRHFGQHDWYNEGADWIIKNQQKDGSWRTSDGPVTINGLADTAFALLFLTYGRAPLVMSKLQYFDNGVAGKPVAAPWNQRPRDAANITRWIGKSYERLLNWQVVNLEAPLPEMLEAPILYMAGNKPLRFSDAEKAKLRLYVETGGLVLGNADCGDAGFGESFRKLMGELFPKSEFRELAANHVIYTRQQFPRVNWKSPPSVLGLSNGTRELALLIPKDDAARAWQARSAGMRPELHELMSDIYLYCVDRSNLRFKGEQYWLLNADPKAKVTSKLKIARLQHAGNWDPEPAGWRRQVVHMKNDHEMELTVETVKLGDGKWDLSHKLAHLTGTHKMKFSDAEKAELKKFIDSGGTVLIDAAGGSTEFSGAIDNELAGLLPADAAVKALPATHAIYTGPENVPMKWRSYSRSVLGNMRQGRLRGAEINGRLALIVSNEDLSAGLMGSPVDGIVGYDPGTAEAIVSNILLQAAGIATTRPAGK